MAPYIPFILVGCKNDLRTDSNLDYFLSVPGAQNDIENCESVGKCKVCCLSFINYMNHFTFVIAILVAVANAGDSFSFSVPNINLVCRIMQRIDLFFHV